MMWGAFVDDQLVDLIVLDQSVDSKKYIETLAKSMLSILKPDMTFMHDNASIHRSKETFNLLKKKKVNILK